MRSFRNYIDEAVKIKKIQAAEPYSNPGSRNSMLGGAEKARYAVVDSKGTVLARLMPGGGGHWEIWHPTEAKEIGTRAYQNLAKAKQGALDMFKDK